ncbi:MAG: hypothetical protein NVS3B20_26470 [Polyangiales bacterium]
MKERILTEHHRYLSPYFAIASSSFGLLAGGLGALLSYGERGDQPKDIAPHLLGLGCAVSLAALVGIAMAIAHLRRFHSGGPGRNVARVALAAGIFGAALGTWAIGTAVRARIEPPVADHERALLR